MRWVGHSDPHLPIKCKSTAAGANFNRIPGRASVTDSIRSGSLSPARSTPARSALARWIQPAHPLSRKHAHVVGIDQIGHRPAGEVVFGHALVGEGLPLRRLTVGIGPEDREAADFLVAAGIVDLIEFVPSPELATDRVP